MACIINPKVTSTCSVVKTALKTPPTRKLPYEIPERYRNSFYLANAALFDSTNWFLHRAFEVFFPQLKQQLKQNYGGLSDDEIVDKVENIVQVLDQCNSVIDVRFTTKRDSGKYEVVRGFRAHHGAASGFPGNMGGIRIDNHITRDHMKALSVLSTYKNACMGISMAGAFGGIKISPKSYSKSELQQIVQRYAFELVQRGYCNGRDVLQPDVNTNQQEMNWICEAHANITGSNVKIASVGKTTDLGGVADFSQTSAYGTFCALNTFLKNDEIMRKINLSSGLKDKTFIIQGLGKLGKPLTEMLLAEGAICVGVKEHDAYIYDCKGIKFRELWECNLETGSIKNYVNAKEETNDQIFTEECDILILAALQKSLGCYSANKVKAKIIVEGANAPVTPMAHKILTSSSKLVLPDIYACSGSTIAAYLEHLKNLYQVDELCDSLLKKSNATYETALKNLVFVKQRVSANSGISSNISGLNESDIIMETIQCILNDVGKDIITIASLNGLETDFKTAAYIVGMKNIFNNIYNEKRLL